MKNAPTPEDKTPRTQDVPTTTFERNPAHDPDGTATTDAGGAAPNPAANPATDDTVPFTSPAARPTEATVDWQAPPKPRVDATKLPEIPGYQLLGVLGRGGMGVVYQARQRGLKRLVAIKMLLAGEHAGADQLARFQTEAQAVAVLQHPNIVQIYEVGEHQGLPFFSLEYVPGGSLSGRIAGQPQLPHEAAQLVETLARAMHGAHRAGIVHRDLKPANILLSYDERASTAAPDVDARQTWKDVPLSAAIPKISDFGLAMRVDFDSRQTRSGTIMGSPSYMAPEQASGQVRELGPLTDVYALGAILYELLTGRPPFLAATPFDIVQQVIGAEPVAPSRLVGNVPRDLETICLKCLQKESSKRYASAEALADDLRRFQRREPILARPVSGLERLRRWCARNPLVASLTAAAALSVCAIVGISTWTAYTLSVKNAAIDQQRKRADDAALDEKRQADLAKEKKTEAVRQATLALSTIQTLIGKVMEQIGDTPNTLSLKMELLETAVQGAAQVTETDGTSSKEATLLGALQKLGDLYRQKGDTEKAYEKYALVNQEARKRVELLQGSDAARFNLALSCVAMSEYSREFKRDLEGSKKYMDEAVELYEDLLAHPKPGYGALPPFQSRFNLSEAYNARGRHFLRLGDPASAITQFAKSLELLGAVRDTLDEPRQLAGLDDDQKKRAVELAAKLKLATPQFEATALMALGNLSFRLGKNDDADGYLRRSLALRERLAADKPDDLPARLNLSRALGALGDVMLQTDRLADAEPVCRQSLALIQKISEADAARNDYRRDLSVAQYRLANVLRRRGMADEARTLYEQSRDTRQVLAAADAANQKKQVEWKLAEAQCGAHAEVARFLEMIQSESTVDTELQLLVARAYAICAAVATDAPDAAEAYRLQSLRRLKDLLEGGYKDLITLAAEPDFDGLRQDPRFAATLAETKPAAPREP